MQIWPFSRFTGWITAWLTKEHEPEEMAVSDVDRIINEVQPCDVLLVEGRTRASEVIKVTTRSNWSHSALYIGTLKNIKNLEMRALVKKHFHGSIHEPLIIEAELGKGVIVSPIHRYKKDHLRICRPNGITEDDKASVMLYCANRLGEPYNLRRIVDLLRLLFPITFMPRYLFSSIMNPIKARRMRHHICSSLLARAFQSVHFPILPKIVHNKKSGRMQLIRRNTALFTPKDFDFSPYFNIIKYPLFGFEEGKSYQHFPWNKDGLVSNDTAGIYDPKSNIHNKGKDDV